MHLTIFLQEEFFQPASLPEPQHNKDQKSSMMINKPTPVMMTASATNTCNNFVRFTLATLLSMFLFF